MLNSWHLQQPDELVQFETRPQHAHSTDLTKLSSVRSAGAILLHNTFWSEHYVDLGHFDKNSFFDSQDAGHGHASMSVKEPPQLKRLDSTLPVWRLPPNNPETDVILRVQCLSSQAVKVSSAVN